MYVDMDGTLAEFKKVDTLEKLYEKGYFLNLEPYMNVVDAIRSIVTDHSEIEVYILSAVLSDSPYAVTEKNAWLDQYLPEIDISHRLYPHCGTDKKEFLEREFGSIGNKDFLLDDYSANLHSWEPPAKGIKLMNGINGNHGTFLEITADKLSGAVPGDNIKEVGLVLAIGIAAPTVTGNAERSHVFAGRRLAQLRVRNKAAHKNNHIQHNSVTPSQHAHQGAWRSIRLPRQR